MERIQKSPPSDTSTFTHTSLAAKTPSPVPKQEPQAAPRCFQPETADLPFEEARRRAPWEMSGASGTLGNVFPRAVFRGRPRESRRRGPEREGVCGGGRGGEAAALGLPRCPCGPRGDPGARANWLRSRVRRGSGVGGGDGPAAQAPVPGRPGRGLGLRVRPRLEGLAGMGVREPREAALRSVGEGECAVGGAAWGGFVGGTGTLVTGD